METNFLIDIGIYEFIGIIVALISGGWYLSHRLTKMEMKVEGFDTRLSGMESRFDARLASMDNKLDSCWTDIENRFDARLTSIRDLLLGKYDFKPEGLDK